MLHNSTTTSHGCQVTIEGGSYVDLFTNTECLDISMVNNITCQKVTKDDSELSIDVRMLCYDVIFDKVKPLNCVSKDEESIPITSVNIEDGVIVLGTRIKGGKYILITGDSVHIFKKYYNSDTIEYHELHKEDTSWNEHIKALESISKKFNEGVLKLYPVQHYSMDLVRSHKLTEVLNHLPIITSKPPAINIEGNFLYRLFIRIYSTHTTEVRVIYSAVCEDILKKLSEEHKNE